MDPSHLWYLCTSTKTKRLDRVRQEQDKLFVDLISVPMSATFLAVAVALAAYSPARVEAFAPSQCSALSLIMSTSRRTGSVVSPQPLTAIARRDVLAGAPLIAAGAGALLAPPAALASFSIGESLQFIPEGGFQSEGAMQWPARLSPDAVLSVGNTRMPAVGFGVYLRAHTRTRTREPKRVGEWWTIGAVRAVCGDGGCVGKRGERYNWLNTVCGVPMYLAPTRRPSTVLFARAPALECFHVEGVKGAKFLCEVH